MMAAQDWKSREKPKRVDVVREPPSVDGRNAPHDLDAEAAVLSALLLAPSQYEQIEFLRAEHFYSEPHRWIFEGCRSLLSEGKACDIILVANWLKSAERIEQVGGLKYINDIIDTAPVVTNLKAYATIVWEAWRLRRFIAICQAYAAKGYFDVGESQSFMGELVTGVEQIVSMGSSGMAFEDADAIFDETDDADEASFLVPALQIGPGRPNLLGGDSYTGKSVCAADIAIGVATGRDVLGLFRVDAPGGVRWLNYDQNPKLARRRIRRLARAKGLSKSELRGKLQVVHFPELRLDDDDALRKLITIARGWKLIVIDALIGSVERVQEKDEQMGRVLLKLMHASYATGCTFLVIHHTVKPQGELLDRNGKPIKGRRTSKPASAALRGNRAIYGACDSVLVLESTGKKKPVRVVHDKAPNDGNTLDPFYVQFVDVEEPIAEWSNLAELDANAKRIANNRWGLRIEHLEPEQVEVDEPPKRKEQPAEKVLAAANAKKEEWDAKCAAMLEFLKRQVVGTSFAEVCEKGPYKKRGLVNIILKELAEKKLAMNEHAETGKEASWRAI